MGSSVLIVGLINTALILLALMYMRGQCRRQHKERNLEMNQLPVSRSAPRSDGTFDDQDAMLGEGYVLMARVCVGSFAV